MCTFSGHQSCKGIVHCLLFFWGNPLQCRVYVFADTCSRLNIVIRKRWLCAFIMQYLWLLGRFLKGWF